MNLGQLLSVWAFAPDFFKLGATTAKQWSLLHREQLGSEGDPELRKEIAAVLQLPGVRDLKSGAEVAKLLGPSRTLSLELWPAAPMLPIPAPNTEEGRAFDEGLKEMARRFADWAKEPGK